MRKQLTAYVSDEEFLRLRNEADRRGITLSRYVKERLIEPDGSAGLTFADATLAAVERRIIRAGRTSAAEVLKPLAHQMTMLLAMMDQFALSVLSHLPELPEAQREQALASGQRRHRGLRAEVEETLSRMELLAPPQKNGTSRHGASA